MLLRLHARLMITSAFLLGLLSAAPRTIAQTPPQPAPAESLEQARQRLIDRGASLQPVPPSPAARTELPEQFDRYRLGSGDSIFVNVQRFSDLSVQVTLDLEGNVIVPLAGAITLKGLTLPQARRRIQAAFNRYLVDPSVDLTLIAQRPVQVTLSGEVVRPGVYPLSAPQLSIALLTAGGTTRLADLRSLRIRRTRSNGTIAERNVDLFTPLQTATALPNIRLEDGDAIVVPTLTVAASQTYDRNLVGRSTLAQPQINIRVLSYAAGTNRSSGAVISRVALPNGSSFVDALTVISPNPDTANLSEVALVRFDPQQGRAVTQELNARTALRGDLSQNPPLEDNDVIIVGRNFISQFTQAINTFTQPFRDVLGFLLFFDSLANSADNLFRP